MDVLYNDLKYLIYEYPHQLHHTSVVDEIEANIFAAKHKISVRQI